MQITLKAVKSLKHGHGDSPTFEAKVVIDGEEAGYVSNDGHGGCNEYHPWSLAAELNEYATTLPPITYPADADDPESKPFTMQPDADTLIFAALTTYGIEKDFKRLVKNRVLIARADGAIVQTKTLSPELLERTLAKGQSEIDRLAGDRGGVALNLLPPAEALARYRTFVERDG